MVERVVVQLEHSKAENITKTLPTFVGRHLEFKICCSEIQWEKMNRHRDTYFMDYFVVFVTMKKLKNAAQPLDKIVQREIHEATWQL
jgi:hypothetical protein